MNFGKPEFKEGPMILKWMGSKRRMIKHIAPLIHSQKFDRYVEPFCGGANVFLGCNIQTPALLCDALPQPIGILNSIRNDLPTFYSDCEKLSAGLFVEGKDFYLKIREQASTPAEYYFLIYNGFNGLIRFGKGGKFNMAFGRRYFKGENIRQDFRKPWTDLLEKLPFKEAQRLLLNQEVKQQDYRKTIVECHPGDFIYVDPPYSFDGERIAGSDYGSRWTYDDDEILCNLLKFLDACGVKWLLSNVAEKKGERNTLYERLYASYNKTEVAYKYVIAKELGVQAREFLIRNF